MSRKITYSSSCDIAAQALGGYERIDPSLDVAIFGLSVNPYNFPHIESDFYNARYIITLPIGDVPALVWLFTIDADNDVTIVHVEEAEDY